MSRLTYEPALATKQSIDSIERDSLGLVPDFRQKGPDDRHAESSLFTQERADEA